MNPEDQYSPIVQTTPTPIPSSTFQQQPQHHHVTPHFSYPLYPYTPTSTIPGADLSNLPMDHGYLDHSSLPLYSPHHIMTAPPFTIDGSETEFDELENDVDGEEEDEVSRSQSTESVKSMRGDDDSIMKDGSPKKKPRVTLARGGACVNCRNRKLKCTGGSLCKNCEKTGQVCRYEEVQKRKPRAQLLEERIAQLEFMLRSKGEVLPPTKLRGIPVFQPPSASPGIDMPKSSASSHRPSFGGSSLSSSSSSVPPPPPLSLKPTMEYNSTMATMNAGLSDISACSALEMALITIVLPHTPHLNMPLHPQRFLAQLSLPPQDPQRPHPALLYILFAEAVRILENAIPPPRLPRPPLSLFPQSFAPAMPAPSMAPSYILSMVQGRSLSFLERARVELDNGIRTVDRMYDLARASVGIARYLYSVGRFIEGWAIPVSRLVISCGLHRATGNTINPNNSPSPIPLVQGGGQGYQYAHSHSSGTTSPVGLPILRMRPVVVPPPRDEVEVAERNMTFWAAKAQDWEAGIGWGWTVSMADDECTTQWPVGWGGIETRLPGGEFYGLKDLHDPSSPLYSSPFPDTTFVLAMRSLGLLHRASHLFDLPIGSIPTPNSPHPTHIPPLETVQAVEQTLRRFRQSIPTSFQDLVNPSQTISSEEIYDGTNDPWWIMLHANLYTAEMMMYKELGLHQRPAYDTAVSCARAIVKLVQRIRLEQWAHVDMIVSLDISLAARFLNKESTRLATTGQLHGSRMASEEAEILRVILARDYARWLPMATLQALIIQRVREGWAEKEGEYERV